MMDRMRRGRLTFYIIFRAAFHRAAAILFAALLLAAPAMAQESAIHQPQPAAIDPGNTEGLSPAAISCMETGAGGAAQETAQQKWDGGAVPEGFCPRGRTLRLYALEHYSAGPKTPKTATEAGGTDSL